MNYLRNITRLFSLMCFITFLSAAAFASQPSYEIKQKANGQYYLMHVLTPEQLMARKEYKEKYQKSDSAQKAEMKKKMKINLELRKKLGLRSTPLTEVERNARREFSQKYGTADEAAKLPLREQLQNDTGFRRRLGIYD